MNPKDNTNNWISHNGARDIKTGSKVLVRNEKDANSRYTVCNFFRPDWISEGYYGNPSDLLFKVLDD